MTYNQPDPADETTADIPHAPDAEFLGATQEGEASTTRKPAEEWVSGDDPMTGAQKSYIDTLAREAGEQVPADLTKAEASEEIDRLRGETHK